MSRSSLVFAAAAFFVPQCLAAATTGTFNVLTYNVAGLPELLSSSDPADDTPQISPKLAPFNVIHVQEDFNYHADLYASDNHPYRTPTSGGAGVGSGLNTLSDFPYIDFSRTTWDDCYINDGDCLTPKGFTFMRIRVSDGLWVDFYNLHADAGSEDGDRSARASNMAQVSDFMSSWSVGMPVVLMGDTNSRYTSPVDSDSLHSLIDAGGLIDSWVKNARGGVFPVEGSDALVCDFPFPDGTTQAEMVACEVVDKMMVRGSSIVLLTPTAFINEDLEFVNASGYPLSDHYPQSSILSWTLSSAVRFSDPMGGPHGDPYNDLPTIYSGGSVPSITSITVRSGSRVDAISYTLSTGTTVSHGGTGGDPTTMTMNSGERVVQITMCEGKHDDKTRVFYINLLTNQGNALVGGETTDDCSTTTIPTDAGAGGKAWGLIGFWGRDGDEMDRVAGIWGAAY